MKVVLDTNVYISAMLFAGKCEEILKLVSQGLFDIVVSKEILSKIRSVLREKFHWMDKQAAEAIRYIRGIAIIVNPEITLSIVNEDPADNKIIECAVASNASYIITGDRNHLLPIKEYEGVKILSPAEFLRL
ncbi:MAG: putative toxin-antitoxin system toxin component, PIN family [Nitrospirae bacterium]|nr:putative toxin-antitoxin system toxin component, PIN family [Nitrospirota bacterium]